MDLELTDTGDIVLAGLLHSGNSGIKGAMMSIDKNWNKKWSKIYENYPGGTNQFTGLTKENPKMVIIECFGMMATKDASGKTNGFAMACGTGIENCFPDDWNSN